MRRGARVDACCVSPINYALMCRSLATQMRYASCKAERPDWAHDANMASAHRQTHLDTSGIMVEKASCARASPLLPHRVP
jgi:hypothetical protein